MLLVFCNLDGAVLTSMTLFIITWMVCTIVFGGYKILNVEGTETDFYHKRLNIHTTNKHIVHQTHTHTYTSQETQVFKVLVRDIYIRDHLFRFQDL